MLLKNVRWYSEDREGYGDIHISKGIITEMGTGLAPRFREQTINLKDCLALPGLINSHDHLDFNLLPISGNPPYRNFTDYAQEIYRPNESPITEMLRISLRDRLLWGGYKNLISGVTTVCHHNPTHQVCANGFPVGVAENIAWSHSLTYSKDPVEDYHQAEGRPFVIHAAEGVDDAARLEIAELERLGMLAENTVIVHGVGLTRTEIERLRSARSALIWCPSSNIRLFGKTAPVDMLKGLIPITLGTDSLLTAAPTMFDELRIARESGLADPKDLFQMVTKNAAKIFRLPNGAGSLQIGGRADIMVLPDRGCAPVETLLDSRPVDLKLVLVSGEICLADLDLNCGRPNAVVEGQPKFLVGKPGKLKRRISEKVGTQAKEILTNPLWQLLQTT